MYFKSLSFCNRNTAVMKKAFPLMFLILALSGICITHVSTAQITTARLNHIAFYVTDLSISTRFYRDIVGLDTIPEPFHDGRHTWFKIGPREHLHIISGATTKTPHDKNAHLCFSVQ